MLGFRESGNFGRFSDILGRHVNTFPFIYGYTQNFIQRAPFGAHRA
jgi:hypothetical protein